MKYLAIAILLTLMANLGCQKIICGCSPNPVAPISAVVMETSNIDCGRPTIKIEPSDTAMVRQMTGLSGDIFVVDALEASLNVTSQKLYVSVRNLQPSEDFACTMQGPTYPHLKMIFAMVRN